MAQQVKRVSVYSEAYRQRRREQMRARRAAAKAAGVSLPSDTWHKDFPDKHRRRVRAWRAANLEHMREINRVSQAARRSTPWGKITNNLVVVLHNGVRGGSARVGKYAAAVGYTWLELRKHLEAQFTPEMTWENWGSVWELDHIRPLSSFQYMSLDDPLFKEAWALSNLRPLPKMANLQKGNRVI